jgi:hypothetical protein
MAEPAKLVMDVTLALTQAKVEVYHILKGKGLSAEDAQLINNTLDTLAIKVAEVSIR